MDGILTLGCLLMLQSVWAQTDLGKCAGPQDTGDEGAVYPRYRRLTFEDLRDTVMDGSISSKPYYEVYSLNPNSLRPFGIPVLRKTVVKWNLVSPLSTFPGNFTNDYAGWFPYGGNCEYGVIDFTTSPGKYMNFQFHNVYPEPVDHVGTTISSCPERYLINWYCPINDLVPNTVNPKYCRNGTRMSIYSPSGPQGLPWEMIVDDLCRNSLPKLEDTRWTFTYDAPEQCEVATTGRMKRSLDAQETQHFP